VGQHLNIDTLYEQVRKAFPQAEGEVATVMQVAPRIRVLALRTPTLPPATQTNAYLVGPERGPQTLIDPGSPYADQQAVLDALLEADAAAGRPLARVLLTHHHGDHTGGARGVAERWHVPIAAHAETAKRLPVVTEVIDDRDVDGIEAIFTPGHAPGHLCYAVGDAVIAGDMVASVGTILIDPSEGDMAAYLASLARLQARPAHVLLPAHGAPIADGHGKLRDYVAHRLMREGKLVAALATRAAASAAELVPDVYGDTPAALWPLAERSLRAHLDKLVRDGRARDLGDRWELL
jgi:glyoxylase-like metal-dependent hydrolase (beta-lactamase superfamily II)